MEELYNLGISENTLKIMMEIEPNLNDLSVKEIQEKEMLLSKIGCSRKEIINIISNNCSFLMRTNEEIIKLISFLNQIGFDNLNILFDANPYILNLEPFEIKEYINKEVCNKKKLVVIIDELDSNPYLFNEI